MRSMTGFGRGSAQVKSVQVVAEVKTVNHKYHDISLKIPTSYQYLESDMREMILAAVTRGKVDVFLKDLSPLRTKTVEVNEALLAEYLKAVHQSSKKLKLSGSLSMESLLRLPDVLVACVNGGSNAIGLFYPFIKDAAVRMIGVEAAGLGISGPHHAATITTGSVGVLHGNKTYLLQDELGQVRETHSIAAGLDYPGVGPEHSWLHDIGRAEYTSVTDAEALDALKTLSETEGIIPALESSHAVAHAIKLAPQLAKEQIMIVNLSGRGDKDMQSVAKALGVTL